MKLKLVITAVMMMVGSTAIAGPGCSSGHDKQAATCIDGATWDEESQSCVPQTTS